MKLCVFSAICIDESHCQRSSIRAFNQWGKWKSWRVEGHLFTNCASRLSKDSLKGWIVHDIPEEAKGLYARKMARYIKLNPEKVLPPCNWSLWLDSNFYPKIHPAQFLSQRLLKNKPKINFFCIPSNHFRCVYREIQHGKAHKLDPNPKAFDKQLVHTRKVGVPPNWLAVQTGLLYRKFSVLKDFNELWWKELNAFTVRDQFSVVSAIWQKKIDVASFKWKEAFKTLKKKGDHSYKTSKPSKKKKSLKVAVKKEVKITVESKKRKRVAIKKKLGKSKITKTLLNTILKRLKK